MKELRPDNHGVTAARSDGAAPRHGAVGAGRIGVEALFRAHASFVAAFLRRLGVPASEVEDLVQEVFLVVHRKGGFEPGAAQPRSWLGAIAVRLARSRHRSAGRNRECADHGAVESASSGLVDPGQRYEMHESLRRVQRALDSLDLDHKAAFVLYELSGESCQAIAASFEVPVGTIYSRLHHARRRFSEVHTELLSRDEQRPARGRPNAITLERGR